MKKKMALLCSILVVWVMNAIAAPVQWEVSSGENGHYYDVIYVPDGLTWTAANLAAQSIPGNWQLVTITSAAENAFVFNLIDDDPNLWNCCLSGHSNGPWIGGYKENNQWKWVTGESFVYQSWGPSEPFGNGDKISFFGYSALIQPYWNDVPDSYPSLPPKGYIVESPGNACPGDINIDGDVDGSDLAEYIIYQTGVSLFDLAGDFGSVDCNQ